MLSGEATNINFHSPWFDPIGNRTHDLPQIYQTIDSNKNVISGVLPMMNLLQISLLL
jgi:hypothetical protein